MSPPGEEPTGVRPLLLGSYAAKTCPRAISNDFDVTLEEPDFETPPALQRLFDSGVAHEAAIVAAVLARLPDDSVDLGSLADDKTAHIAETLSHLQAGTLVVIGGRLPDDLAGARAGKPDLLIRTGVGPGGGHGYHPGDIKWHLTLQSKRGETARVRRLGHPAAIEALALPDTRVRYRPNDLLQLAHYWRMLQACGMEASGAHGVIIGTDLVDGEPVVTWYDLAEPAFTTFSRTQGRARRSALERYDHEHGFRVKVAAVARRRRGAADDPEPLVVPIGQAECDSCRWAPVCVDTLPAGDLSGELGDTLSVREYLALRRGGISTVEDLAGSDTADLLTEAYHQDTADIKMRVSRLTKAAVRAQLARDGLVLRPTSGTTVDDLPVSEVEIDLDVEWSRKGRVYLWGVLVSTGGTSSYRHFVDLAVDDDAAELALARRCLTWLDDTAKSAAADGGATTVFHYSPSEKTRTRGILKTDPGGWHPVRAEVGPDQWVDLLPSVRRAVDSRYGHGLKVIATHGPGFCWRDADPGGRQSQDWLDQARTAATDNDRDAVVVRLLEYNEDDVRAAAAVRSWLRELPS